MEINTSLVFPTDPATVFDMLTNTAFLKEVATESGARDCEVQVHENVTTSKRTLPAPAEAQKFTGPDIKVVEEIIWGHAAPDGGRAATLKLNTPGQPMTMNGTVQLRPVGSDTHVTIKGDLKISVPLLGKKLEKMSAPAIIDGIRAEERVGLRWLRN